MAVERFGVNNAQTNKAWSKRLDVEALKETFYAQYIGATSSSLAQEMTETRKGKGDSITWGLRALGSAEGVSEGQILEGNEESVTHYTDTLLINELRYGVRVKGKDSIDAQRVLMNLEEEAYDQSNDWWKERLDTCFFNVLGGNTAQSNLKFTGFNTPLAPSANRVLRAGGVANDQGLGSGNVLTLSMIDKAVNKAKTSTPPLRPLKNLGADVDWLLFIHPDQTLSLRTDATTAGNWFDLQKARLQGGDGSKNGLFTGSVGIYNRTLIVESTRVPQAVNASTGLTIANTRRAIFCGAQAMAVAFGMNGGPTKFTWKEETFDYEDELGVKSGLIFGMKKSRYNSEDYGVITIATWAAPAS